MVKAMMELSQPFNQSGLGRQSISILGPQVPWPPKHYLMLLLWMTSVHACLLVLLTSLSLHQHSPLSLSHTHTQRKASQMGEEGNPSLQSPLIPSYEENLECRGEERLANGDWKGEILDEVKKQMWSGGPLVFISLMKKFLQVISVMFVGHLGEFSLSSASLATSFAGITGFSLLVSCCFPYGWHTFVHTSFSTWYCTMLYTASSSWCWLLSYYTSTDLNIWRKVQVTFHRRICFSPHLTIP